MLLLVIKALGGLAQAYLSDMLPFYEPGQTLRFSGTWTL